MRNPNPLTNDVRMSAAECETAAGFHRRAAARLYDRAKAAGGASNRAECARCVSVAFWHDHTARAFEARGRALREAGL